MLHFSQKVECSGKRRLRIDVLGAWEKGCIFPKQPSVHLDVRREERGDKFDGVLHTGLKVVQLVLDVLPLEPLCITTATKRNLVVHNHRTLPVAKHALPIA